MIVRRQMILQSDHMTGWFWIAIISPLAVCLFFNERSHVYASHIFTFSESPYSISHFSAFSSTSHSAAKLTFLPIFSFPFSGSWKNSDSGNRYIAPGWAQMHCGGTHKDFWVAPHFPRIAFSTLFPLLILLTASFALYFPCFLLSFPPTNQLI